MLAVGQLNIVTPLQARHLPQLQRTRLAYRRPRAVKEFDLGTVYSGGKEANWLAPEVSKSCSSMYVMPPGYLPYTYAVSESKFA